MVARDFSFLLFLALLCACTGNSSSETRPADSHADGRPTEVGEGLPGYIVKPGQIVLVRESDKVTLSAAANTVRPVNGEGRVALSVWQVPQSVLDAIEPTTGENIEIPGTEVLSFLSEPDGSMNAEFTLTGLDPVIVTTLSDSARGVITLSQTDEGFPTAIIKKDLESNDPVEPLYPSSFSEPQWIGISNSGAPSPRSGHTAVWTGTEMIVWGGRDGAGIETNGGARYNPETDTWTSMSSIGAPTKRRNHTALWTGTEMIIWGGVKSGTVSDEGVLDGARYNPQTDSWTWVAPGGSGTPIGQAAVWVGDRMLTYGGSGDPGPVAELYSYSLPSEQWAFEPSGGNEPSFDHEPRFDHSMVFTGTQFLIFGGINRTTLNSPSSNLSLNLVSQNQTAISSIGAPSNRRGHAALWTGTEMIIWGNATDGGIYHPTTDSWTLIATNGAPAARSPKAVWTGNRMIAWGGTAGSPSDSGGFFDPLTNTWTRATPSENSPAARYDHSVVWTGSEMIVWGGFDTTVPVDTGSRLIP